MSKNYKGLLTGLAVGAGLGILFAPKKGSETRKDLAKQINKMWEELKNIDYEEVKNSIGEKIVELQEELEDLDKEKVLEIAKAKGTEIKTKAEELYNLAVKKGTPVLEKAAKEVREKTIEVLNNTVAKLEEGNKTTKKATK